MSFSLSDCQQEASPSVLAGSPSFVGDTLAETWDLPGSATCLPPTRAAPFYLGAPTQL